MSRPIKAVVYGVGETGSDVVRLLLDKGVEIVGAIARSDAKVGRDLGEVTGLGEVLGVPVRRDAEELLEEVEADIAVIATNNHLDEHEPHLAVCARTGTNAITASAESLYPWRTSPGSAARLDGLAKAGGVTLTGGGMQDVYWIGLVTALLGAAHEVRSVSGFFSFNLDDIGPDAARADRIGLPPEEFVAAGEAAANSSLNGLHCLASALGLTVREATSEAHPVVAGQPVYSRSLGQTIKAGCIAGRTEVDRLTTAEGITLTLTGSGYIYGSEEGERNEWTVEGVPNLKLANPEMPVRIGTGAQLVNRIPDVINAEPGFVTVERLPPLRYRSRPLETYLTGSHRPGSTSSVGAEQSQEMNK